MSVQGADESSWKSSCCLCVSFAVSFCVAVVLCQPVGLYNRVDFGLTAFCNFFPAECDICVWFDRPLVDWVSCQPGSWHVDGSCLPCVLTEWTLRKSMMIHGHSHRGRAVIEWLMLCPTPRPPLCLQRDAFMAAASPAELTLGRL